MEATIGRLGQSRNRALDTLLYWWRKYIPHLVWEGQEVDVLVSFKSGALYNTEDKWPWGVEDGMEQLGIKFDMGSGLDGRKWYWDWSLRGPISVSFRRVTEEPEKRFFPGYSCRPSYNDPSWWKV